MPSKVACIPKIAFLFSSLAKNSMNSTFELLYSGFCVFCVFCFSFSSSSSSCSVAFIFNLCCPPFRSSFPKRLQNNSKKARNQILHRNSQKTKKTKQAKAESIRNVTLSLSPHINLPILFYYCVYFIHSL